jgi:hypothetical protein
MKESEREQFVKLLLEGKHIQTHPKAPIDSFKIEFSDDTFYQNVGLTKREYFAAMAMQSLILLMQNELLYDKHHITQDSVNFADELIEALNK